MHVRWWVRGFCPELVSGLCIKEMQSWADGYIRDWWFWHNATCEYACVFACRCEYITYLLCVCIYIRILGCNDVCRAHISRLRQICVCALDVHHCLFRWGMNLYNCRERKQKSKAEWRITSSSVLTAKTGNARSQRLHIFCLWCPNKRGLTEGLVDSTLQDFTFIKLHVSLCSACSPLSTTIFHFATGLPLRDSGLWMRCKISWWI